MARKPTIGANPLDTLMPSKSAGGDKPQAKEPPKRVRERVTFQLPIEVVERARDAVVFTPGLTLASLVTDAIEEQLTKLEKARGEPFPSRKGQAMKPGRPVKMN